MNEVKTNSYSFNPGDCYCYRRDNYYILIKIIEEKDGDVFCQYIKINNKDFIVRDYVRVKEEDKPLLIYCSNEMFEEAYQEIVEMYGKVRALCQPFKYLAEDRKLTIGDCVMIESPFCWILIYIFDEEFKDYFHVSCYYISKSLDKISLDFIRNHVPKKFLKKMRKIDPQILQQICDIYEPVLHNIYYLIEIRYELCKKFS